MARGFQAKSTYFTGSVLKKMQRIHSAILRVFCGDVNWPLISQEPRQAELALVT
jgi:hypothetical protein